MTDTTPDPPLLAADDLHRTFPGGPPVLRGISLHLPPGRTLGLVGASGSGKSTVARLLVGLDTPDRGCVRFRVTPLPELDRGARLDFRRTVQLIAQNPGATLHPDHRIGRQITEPALVHGLCRRRDRADRAAELLRTCDLDPDLAPRLPRELSGGQRQRAAIARALSVEPDVLICDEPTSALDVHAQREIITLLRTLQRDRDLACLFISHDLALVRQLCDDTLVLDRGIIVEQNTTEAIIDDPHHPASRALVEAVPRIRYHDTSDPGSRPWSSTTP